MIDQLMTEEDMNACLNATTWNKADLGYFRGGGYSSRFLFGQMLDFTK